MVADSKRLVVAIGVVVGFAGVSGRTATGASLGYRVQSPAAQQGVHTTTSAIESTFVWPSASDNKLDFNWYVDSEAGWDFLRVFVDGGLAYQWSGLGRAGHVSHPVTAGSHTVRFEYFKDGSVNRGRDLAWVDDIFATGGGRVLEHHHFDVRAPSLSDWTASGYGGGFQASLGGIDRVIERPIAQAFTGVTASPSTSRTERTITWPSGTSASFDFDWLVDSEANWDFLKVYVDGAVQWSVSGYDVGHKSIAVTPGASHTIAFEYAKDTSVDTGRDLALVTNVRALVDDALHESHPFDGLAISTAPDGWTSSGVAGGWGISNPPPAIAYVAKGTPSVEPTVDGRIDLLPGQTEYVQPTILPAFDVASGEGAVGTVILRESDASEALYVGLRLHAATAALGGETGDLMVYLDANRPDTLLGIGCGRLPGYEDRRLTISYSSSSGQPSASISQALGNCQGAWGAIAAGSEDEWPVAIVVTEPAKDPGFLHIELKITLRPGTAASSTVLSDGKVGFGFVHRNLTGSVSRENVPAIRGAQLPDNDVMRLLTLDMTSSTGSPADGEVRARPATGPAPLGFIGVR